MTTQTLVSLGARRRRRGVPWHGTNRIVHSKDGTRISYLLVGTGPAVLVIPGVLSMAADYAAFARALSEHFTVHTLSAGDEARAARKAMITASSKSVRTCSPCKRRQAPPWSLATATVDWLPWK